MNSSQGSSKVNINRILPGILISIVALIVVFRLANWNDFGKVIFSVKPFTLFLVLILTLIYLGFRAIAWKILLEDRVKVSETFWALNIGYLLNNLFPLRAGELGRAIILGQSSGMGTVRILSTIVIERAFDLAFAAISLLITLPLALGMDWIRPIANTTLALVITGVFTLFLMARYSIIVQKWALNLGQKWSLFQKYIIPQLDAILIGLKVLTNLKRFILSLVWIGGSWVVAFVVYYVMLTTLVPNPPFWWGIFADSILAMGIAVPSAPAALGVFEASLVGALSLLGISNSSALAYAIIMHFMQFIITGILGFYAISKQGRSLRSLFSSAQLKKNKAENE